MKEARPRRPGHPPAFTLVELLVVIAIIVILAALLMPAVTRVTRQARANRALVEMEQLASIITQVYSDVGAYVRLEDLVLSSPAGTRRWTNADYFNGQSDNEVMRDLSGREISWGTHAGPDGSATLSPNPASISWPPYPGLRDYLVDNLARREAAFIVEHTNTAITVTDPPLDWDSGDRFRILAPRDAPSWSGPYTTYRNFADAGGGRQRPLDPWGDRRDLLTAPFHQYRMFWSTLPDIRPAGASGTMVIISPGPSGRYQSGINARPDTAGRVDFSNFNPFANDQGDDVWFNFNAGIQ